MYIYIIRSVVAKSRAEVWPCETYAPVNVRGRALRGSSRTFEST